VARRGTSLVTAASRALEDVEVLVAAAEEDTEVAAAAEVS
jgi:hypothetical protein